MLEMVRGMIADLFWSVVLGVQIAHLQMTLGNLCLFKSGVHGNFMTFHSNQLM
jgi:hypothetical protein